MAVIPNSVRVTGLIAPSDDTDVYPSHDSTYGKGGYREVADIPALAAIPSDRQRVGMLVWVADSDGLGNPQTYILDTVADPGLYSVAFSLVNEWADGGTFLNPTDGIAKQVVVGQLAAPDDAGAIMQVSNGHLQIGGTWNGGHFVMGVAPNAYHIWVDATGNLRIKLGAPTGDLEGTVVGAQNV